MRRLLLPLSLALALAAPAAADHGGNPLTQGWSHGTCKGKGRATLGAPPMRLQDVFAVTPYGVMVGGHVTPIDHGYFEPKDRARGRSVYDVLAPGNGWIVSIQTRPNGPDHDYRVAIELSCTFYVYYDLITQLSPRVLKEAGWTDASQGSVGPRIPVKEGEVIGRIGAQTLDVGVVDRTKTLKGLLVPAHYLAEPWKVHTVDLFASFKQPLRAKLLALDIRKAAPRTGRIDYDVDGRLVGNWFRRGTSWYGGTCDRSASPSGCDYWGGHLSVVYDVLDPSQIRVSVGDFGGEARQFGVRGNAPDPSAVSQASGLVKYELAGFGYVDIATGQPFTWRAFPTAGLRSELQDFPSGGGVILVQLVGPRLLKVETFPGKTAADVSGFTPAAKLYER